MMINMKTIAKYLCCPICKKEMVLKKNEAFHCSSCNHTYPIICGIPDFRVFAPPYIDIENDIKMARILDSKFDALNHESLIRFRMKLSKERSPDYPDDLLEAHMQFKLSDREKAGRIYKLLNETKLQGNDGQDLGLDIGCGTGAGVLAISNICDISVGVDILLTDIIIAKKLLQAEGIKDFFIACSCAEHLPFKDNTFPFAISRDVIEHVSKQINYLSEATRILKKGASFVFNSPNRFMLGLEPHVKLKRVGFLPRKLQPLYVKIRKNETYLERLLSYFELTRMLNSLSLRYSLLNRQCRIDTTKPSTSLTGKLCRSVPSLVSFINKYYYLVQYDHEIIVHKD